VFGRGISAAACFLLAVLDPASAADRIPVKVGDCARTHVAKLEQRLADGKTGTPVPGSGSAITFTDGLYQVSYDEVDAINNSRVGDPVFVCLIELPKNCPPGDHRGKIYTATNLRRLESWTLPDSEHECGGA
jgi:hypothetical protein